MNFPSGARDCPEGGRDRGRKPRSGRGDSDACFNCGQSGHMARDCPTNQGGRGGRGRGGDRSERGGGRREKLSEDQLDKQLDDYWKEDGDEASKDKESDKGGD